MIDPQRKELTNPHDSRLAEDTNGHRGSRQAPCASKNTLGLEVEGSDISSTAAGAHPAQRAAGRIGSHSLTKNLVYAEAAVKYVEAKLFLGSTNRSLDEEHGRSLPGELADSAIREDLLCRLRNNVGQSQPLGMSAGVAALWTADKFEEAGIGNCGEQARVAFKYLLHHTDAKEVSTLNVGDNHQLVVIGASRSELENAASRHSTYSLVIPPSLPEETVFCDPWYHEWFPVSEWPNKIKSILRATQVANENTPLDDEERTMREEMGFSIGPRQFSEDWKEIEVWTEGSREPSTIADYQVYLHNHPASAAPAYPGRAAATKVAESHADAHGASLRQNTGASYRRALDERSRSRNASR